MDSLFHRLFGDFEGIEPHSIAAPIPPRCVGDRGGIGGLDEGYTDSSLSAKMNLRLAKSEKFDL